MAEGVITVVVDHLLKMAATEFVSLMGLRKELENLSSEFCAIKNVIQDAETRQISEESVRSWLQKLKYVAYDLEDMLEEWRILEVDAVTTSPFTHCFGAHQVINLGDCVHLEELPEGISAMASLRRLNIERCWRLKKLPQGIGRRDDVVVILDRFPVVAAGRDAGEGCSSDIGELGGRNMHLPLGRRDLDIFNLEKVGSREEARTAKIEEKTDLESLTLSWNSDNNKMDDVTVAEADGVLEGFCPPPQLLKLSIQCYPGQAFPSWMGDGGAFRRLQQVELKYCKNCTQLPALGQLPSLEKLIIVGLQGVERVGREFFGGPSPTFPCLTELYFLYMRNWSEWVALPPISDDEEGSTESPIMPALRILKLLGSSKLEAMPPIFNTSLRELTIDDSSPMLYHSSLQFLPPYKTISILGDHYFGSRYGTHPGIDVVISVGATELPGGLLHHTALRRLKLVNLSHLRSLPEELTQLMDLQQLLIKKCPELSGRCRVGGELWPRIAHIPHIQIDGQDIQCST